MILAVRAGAISRDIVPEGDDLTKSAFAAAFGILRQMLHGILAGKLPVTVDMAVLDMAVRLGHVSGIWLCMQQARDLRHAERRTDTGKLKSLHPHKAA